MKKSIYYFFFPAGILLYQLFSSTLAFAACTQTLNIAYDGHWPPYQYTINNKPKGIDLVLINHIMKRIGCNLVYKRVAHNRVANDLKLGWADVALSLPRTLQNKNGLYFSNTIRQRQLSLFVLKKNALRFNFPSLLDLLNTTFKLGTSLGGHYGPLYQQFVQRGGSLNIRTADNDYELPRLLITKKLNGYLMETQRGYYLLKKVRLLSQITSTETRIESDPAPLYIAFSKKTVSRSLVKQVNAALVEMQIDGTLEKILNAYSPKR
ncbi:lysine-arginine-ornithine-binding periplasmic protein [Piscirickettsia salmonis]|uniref:substrate-binding periplasmic protein n=1 Tax=Piscirickettsia salmonis TaxID=1238 RepID=UPI0012B79B2D|nr:transporter substrate-binding domain-containing protein [Piscirickettsia salmonis]QGO65869.1 lysine-arginine-ornithine-binding periplasmic protein [Piscirickettsia salmonis]